MPPPEAVNNISAWPVSSFEDRTEYDVIFPHGKMIHVNAHQDGMFSAHGITSGYSFVDFLLDMNKLISQNPDRPSSGTLEVTPNPALKQWSTWPHLLSFAYPLLPQKFVASPERSLQCVQISNDEEHVSYIMGTPETTPPTNASLIIRTPSDTPGFNQLFELFANACAPNDSRLATKLGQYIVDELTFRSPK